MVTHAGGKQLEEPLVVRPTSETVIGEFMAKWISSHRDLPLLLNQWANVVRWELRPRMFLRTTEFLWQEGHTAHADEADAMRETMLALETIYARTARELAAMPVVEGEKTPGERFAGAVRTFTIEAMMRDGRALQAGTSHYLGTNFAQAFDIQYTGEDGRRSYAHTTSWGMSTRMIGGVIMTHGDDKGLVLPPRLAPYQVVIVPIGRGDGVGEVIAAAAGAGRRGWPTRASGRTSTTGRSVSPGFKFNDWELRGVPIRLELGPRDLAAGTRGDGPAARARARSRSRSTARPRGWPTSSTAFQDFLLARATAFRDEHTVAPTSGTTSSRRSPPAGRWRCTAARRSARRRSRPRPGPPPAASRWTGRRSPAPASAAACRRPTASGSSSAAPTSSGLTGRRGPSRPAGPARKRCSASVCARSSARW